MVSTTTQPIAGQYWLWREQKIYFVKAGHNPQLPPLLLVHGFGASTDHWRKNISELSQDFEVYAIDYFLTYFQGWLELVIKRFN